MAAAATEATTLTVGAWVDVTPTGTILIIAALSETVLVCIASSSAGSTALTAPAIPLKAGEKMLLTTSDLGGAKVHLRSSDLASPAAKVIIAR